MAILFGVLCIITGLLLPLLFGWIGFAIPMVFGVLAIVFAILKNKKAKEEGVPTSKAGFVCAAVGMVLAIVLIIGLQVAGNKFRTAMDKYGVSHFPILDKSVDHLKSGGVVGLIVYAKNEVSANVDSIKSEFDALMKSMNEDQAPADNGGEQQQGGEGAEQQQGGEGAEQQQGGEGAEQQGGEGAEQQGGEEGGADQSEVPESGVEEGAAQE